MSLDAMKQALEALERGETKLRYEAITALRAAIEQAQPELEQAMTDAIIGGTGVMLGDTRIDPASIYKQPEQEPVAWVGPSWLNPETRTWESESFAPGPINGWIPLYTAPRQWQGLTDEEIAEVISGQFAERNYWVKITKALEAKLKEKNA